MTGETDRVWSENQNITEQIRYISTADMSQPLHPWQIPMCSPALISNKAQYMKHNIYSMVTSDCTRVFTVQGQSKSSNFVPTECTYINSHYSFITHYFQDTAPLNRKKAFTPSWESLSNFVTKFPVQTLEALRYFSVKTLWFSLQLACRNTHFF